MKRQAQRRGRRARRARRTCWAWAALAAALASGPGLAESKLLSAGLTVHYSVLDSRDILPEIAQAYGIVRGGQHGLVSIALRRERDDGSDVAVAAAASGAWRDLIHHHPLAFREVRESGAIYYLADLRFNHRETMYFELTLRLLPDGPSYPLKFRHALHAD